MIIVFAVEAAVCFLILKWLLKKKTGEPFSRKMVAKLLGFGALSIIVFMAITLFLPIERDTFFGLNPVLAGFLTALLTAGLFEELMKYIFFRLALIKNREVISWLDAVIAAIIVGMGFTLLEDLEFVVSGDTNILRAIVPAHLLFQAIMGYYYGKARVTGKSIYDVLSLAVPVLIHTFFDMFLISLMAIFGDKINSPEQLTAEEVMNLPYWGYAIPLLIGAVASIVIIFIAMIMMFKRIGSWSRNGEKQEKLKAE